MLARVPGLTRRLAAVLAVSFVAWAAAQSFFSVSPAIARSLSRSDPPSAQARAVAAMASGARVPRSPSTTILYLNGIDGGDNFYRVRYLLYPIHFVAYWSWSRPNAGGYVWNTPTFSSAAGLRRVLLQDRVQYVIAASHPALLRLIGLPSSGLYLFAVNSGALRRGASLRQSLRRVVRRPWP